MFSCSHIESLNVQPRRPSSVTTMGIAERTAGIKKVFSLHLSERKQTRNLKIFRSHRRRTMWRSLSTCHSSLNCNRAPTIDSVRVIRCMLLCACWNKVCQHKIFEFSRILSFFFRIEAKSPSRKGPQPVFAFNATLKLGGVALPTCVLI